MALLSPAGQAALQTVNNSLVNAYVYASEVGTSATWGLSMEMDAGQAIYPGSGSFGSGITGNGPDYFLP